MKEALNNNDLVAIFLYLESIYSSFQMRVLERKLLSRQKDLLKPTKSIFKTNILLDYGL